MRPAAARAVDRLRPVAATVTPLGRFVAGLGLVSYVAGVRLGWRELLLLAAVCLALLVLAAGFTLGRTTLRVTIDVTPQRLPVGESAGGRVEVVNVSSRRLLPVRLEVPIGAAAARFDLPSLASENRHEQNFYVPTTRRAVIAVGPATSVRGDVLGLLRRNKVWTGQLDIYVHPRVIPLPATGWGFLRDLEGRTADEISASDLAFHALREYVPGDDLRHVHWRSSARTGQLMVRQYLDTRRTHLLVVTDGRLTAYGQEDDFETALSATGSLGLRQVRDGQDMSAVAADQATVRGGGGQLLDALARATATTTGLITQTRKAVQLAPDASVGILVTGATTPFRELYEAATLFPPGTLLLTLRVDGTAEPALSRAGGLTGMSIRTLQDLPALITAAASA